ncbi:hypothetical protein CEP52_017710 [Fusarium oligoseptatum]|uniref:Uncharacterized protein n=1 Tax=Fusarium oligoseptatum TaxID=2604345 RepID=A0A428RIX2_9HYPO|nr:hypothetical protein CEP52_017710 [Fusarium oligoseptatum]
MLFTTLILIFTIAARAFRPPFLPRRDVATSACTSTSTLPPVTLTSIFPASTIGASGRVQVTGGGSLVYTTALPTIGPDGPGLHVYTVTTGCPAPGGSQCQRPATNECPPGFTTTAVVCHVCGEHPVTVVLTLPSATATGTHWLPDSYGSENNKYPNTGCKNGSCAHGSVPSSLIKIVHPTSLDAAMTTGSLFSSSFPGAPGSSYNSGASKNTGNTRPSSIAQHPGSPEPAGSAIGPDSQRPTMGSNNGATRGEVAQETISSTYPSDKATGAVSTIVQVTGSSSINRAANAILLWLMAASVLACGSAYIEF